MGTPERLFDTAMGALLVAAALYLAAKPTQHARVIEDYYQRRKALETAKGWLGKSVFLPGRRTSVAMLFVLVAAMGTLGACGLVIGLRG